MRVLATFLLLLINVCVSSAQIRTVEEYKHTIEFLTQKFRLDTFNTKCSTCINCREEFLKDSLVRADTTSYKWYDGSRALGNCQALKKLLLLFQLDLDLQAKVKEMENKFKTSDQLLNKNYKESNLQWYKELDTMSKYYLFDSMKTQSGWLHEQLDFAIIMLGSRLSELQAIDKLLSE